jgi:hypothetical protein
MAPTVLLAPMGWMAPLDRQALRVRPAWGQQAQQDLQEPMVPMVPRVRMGPTELQEPQGSTVRMGLMGCQDSLVLMVLLGLLGPTVSMEQRVRRVRRDAQGLRVGQRAQMGMMVPPDRQDQPDRKDLVVLRETRDLLGYLETRVPPVRLERLDRQGQPD